ncbi:MAG: SDR family oxidoreductase [Sedimentisphaerales bacterium]|nr:SDR family oxidoreductase [Sedimentisphaerales bacterium]
MNVQKLFDLTGKVALVTGAARGLGQQMAFALAEAGADVCFCDLLVEESKETAREIEKMGRRTFFKSVDVTKTAEIEVFLDEIEKNVGGVDILLNNVGITSEGCPIEEVADELWNKIIDTNMSSMFYVAKAVGKRMIAAGKGGSIINMSSISGLIISKIFPRHNVTYGVSKAGIAHLTRGLASEWAQYNIRVNAIAPGYMLTANTQASRKFPEIVERLTEMTPMKRYGQPWELKGAAVFLASEASSYMTGSVVVIDGGNTVW